MRCSQIGGGILSQTKYKLEGQLKPLCINLVRDYDRRVLLYHERRSAIIYSSSRPNIISETMMVNGQKITIADFGGRGNTISNEPQSKASLLEGIEDLPDTKAMRAVELAKHEIGIDCENEECRQNLTNAIWMSCIKGRNFKLEYHNIHVGKTAFYERRRKFLYDIAKNMGYL